MKYESAYLRQNPKTEKWQGFIRYKTAEGKWRQTGKTFPATVKTRKQAEKALQIWRAEKELEAVTDTWLPDSETRVGDYVSAFIDDMESSKSIEPRTITGYRTIAARIMDGFSDVRMRELSPTMIQKWENSLSTGGLAPSTVISYHRLLSEACTHAVNVDVLPKNPCTAVKTPKRKSPTPNSLDAEGFARLAVTLDHMEPSPVTVAAAIALYTGMRQGEICGLRWRDYDPKRSIITVNESISAAKGGSYSKQPKTKSSIRILPVSMELATVLRRRLAHVIEELQVHNVHLTPQEFGALYIIGYIDGRFFTPNAVSHRWKRLSTEFGLIGTQGRAVTFHDLRHSFATRAIAAGADVKAVSAILGHTNAAITLNVYADADPDSKRRASNLVAEATKAVGEVYPYAVAALPAKTPE